MSTAGDKLEAESIERETKSNTDEVELPAYTGAGGVNEAAAEAPALPPKPPRPVSPFTRAQSDLKEAFPDVEPHYIKAVLIAAQGDLDRAVSAFLSMSDPNYKPDFRIGQSQPPMPPSRQSAEQFEYYGDGDRSRAARLQIETDEALARRLARHYSAAPAPPPRRSREGRYSPKFSGRYDDENRVHEPERSFLDDELPEITRNITEGLNDTKMKVTEWMSNFKKKLDSNSTSDAGAPRLFGALTTPPSRPSSRFDDDPSQLDSDFKGIKLKNSASPVDQNPTAPFHAGAQQSTRSSTGYSALGGDDSLRTSLRPHVHTGASNKWEPLKRTAPVPQNDDSFLIGDSDEEEAELYKSQAKKEVK